MDKPVTFAICGLGIRGLEAYAAFQKQHPEKMKITAGADPDPDRRAALQANYGVPAGSCFATGEELLAQPRLADVMIIATQDRQHVAQALAALDKGYHLVLEKPISPLLDECLALQKKAHEANRVVVVCHVLRYTKFYGTLYELLRGGTIGRIESLDAVENVAYWHYAHSYVRGNWHKTADSSPMILAKCCHDMDILSWLLGSRCRTVSSFGDLRYFREENAPAGSPARCTDGCPHSGSCPYYAPALYLDDNTPWPTALTALGPDQSYEARKKALEEGPYGKCVFHNDNDVVDHQVASLLFENGTTVAFTMCAFSDACDRTVKFMGTRGEIRASMDNNVIEVTQFGAGVRTGTTAVYTVKPGSTGHSGGDEGIMEEFVSILKGERENTNTIAQSVHSHVMAFAAEESRLTGRTVDVADFEKSVMA